MSDVMDIMNLKEVAAARPSEAAQIVNSLKKAEPPKQKKERKPEGFSRELYSLIGGLPSVVPADQGFKEKPKMGQAKAVPWTLAPFTNSARLDGMVLSHWVKAEEIDGREYLFAKFNKKTVVLRYTDEEYATYFEDSSWTREETDELLDACERYDLRFIVLYDRMETTKSLEELKARYYSIAKKLMELRHGPVDPADPNSKAFLDELAKYDFDQAREVERKAQLDLLHKRTPEQIKEEEFLILESRKIEQNSKRLLRDREHVIKLLNTIDSAFPIKKFYPQKRAEMEAASKMAIKPQATADSLEPLKKKKRLLSKTFSEDGAPSTPSHSQGLLDPMDTSPAASLKKKEKMPPGPSLRSTRLLAPLSIGTKAAKRIDQFFEELSIPVRPTMPTIQVCQVFDDIRGDILNLLELKRVVDKKELDLKTLQNRKAQLEQLLAEKGAE